MKQITYSCHLKVCVEVPDDVDYIDLWDDWDLKDGEVILSGIKSYKSELIEVYPVDIREVFEDNPYYKNIGG
jgi:hypothetical protein